MKYKIGVVGLGVMGHNLALNMERNGFPVVGYDLDSQKTNSFLGGEAIGKNIAGAESASALVSMLETPRRIILLVPAGDPVDDAIDHFKPFLAKADILIDGGNSHFLDTERRSRFLDPEGFNYLGTGVSGGEEGALKGPSMMPGGHWEAWKACEPIFRAISAKAEDGEPCVAYMGPGGAGHYVKMVHNGIEYGDMQLIAEVYDLLHRGLGMNADDLGEVFAEWNTTELKSYLIEITAQILQHIDPETGKPLIDIIIDEAAQKGTGKWASQNSMDIGAPIPTINAAVESRILSSLKSQRVKASKILHGPKRKFRGNHRKFIDAARQALYASKITSYAQGFGLLKMASSEYKYEFNLNEIAKIWRAGCIIRASLLEDIMTSYLRDPKLTNLLLDESIQVTVESCQKAWRFIIQSAVGMGIPVQALSASLAYFDAYRSERLPANLIQAQRDYFGAHSYRRMDREGTFHTKW